MHLYAHSLNLCGSLSCPMPKAGAGHRPWLSHGLQSPQTRQQKAGMEVKQLRLKASLCYGMLSLQVEAATAMQQCQHHKAKFLQKIGSLVICIIWSHLFVNARPIICNLSRISGVSLGNRMVIDSNSQIPTCLFNSSPIQVLKIINLLESFQLGQP